MSLFHKNILTGASGAAGGASGALYVDDVFSTFLYTGTGAAQTITNEIDLDGEGGLVWIKNRSRSTSHVLFDTERGASTGTSNTQNKVLASNSTSEEGLGSLVAGISSFNSNGFTLDGSQISPYNANGPSTEDYVSWTFRKAPGFFDVVTYTGNSTAGRTVSHNLGSVPGVIIVKNLSSSNNWPVFHRSLGATKILELNESDDATTTSAYWNDTAPTSTNFTLGSLSNVNGSGKNYVAYLFAHDDQSFGTDSDEAIIKCGGYTGTGAAGLNVNLGFEPQWLLVKKTSENADWLMQDVMRGMTASGGNPLYANSTISEQSDPYFSPFSNGFVLNGTQTEANDSGEEYVYIAIRRPHKPPSAGTDVYENFHRTSYGFMDTGFDVDMNFLKSTSHSYDPQFNFRLTGDRRGFHTNSTDVPSSSGSSYRVEFDNSEGLEEVYSENWSTRHDTFRRAPGFLDIAAYAGDGTNGQVVKHNLGVEPELLIVKNIDSSQNWFVCANLTSSGFDLLNLNNTYTHQARTYPAFVSSKPTATSITFTGGSFNDNNKDFLAITFASLDGISKVGTYSGTGSNINVDCGFTAGARFVLIKRVATSGNWYTWNSDRGIVSGNDPYILMNSSSQEVTNQDYIDPLSAGFTVTSSAPAELNTSGGTYIFLAIA